MEPWFKATTPRKEVREGRSFNPDEFAIALEQVVAGTAPQDYTDPVKFFARTCFTRALRDHAGMVLRRLAGETANTAPVLTLVTQFGGGKTHTLTTLFHIAQHGEALYANPETSDMLSRVELPVVRGVRTAVFVGNAWDPREGRETPWIDIARQLAGDAGVAALGSAARTTPPGTEALQSVFRLASGPVLILMDEVLNFFNRHRALSEPSYAFFDNLYRAMTGTTHGAVLISLPRSQVEMTEWDLQWQEKITKVARRVAKDLIANDETEIAEVVRRRLFEDIGQERVRKATAKVFADWCFERRAQLPSEWTTVDTASTETKARELLRERFEACYPFHPSTLSVFQRKWQTLAQYQQTRGTLAMLAQWVALVYRESYEQARKEPLITLGRAPLESPGFRAVVLGQLGEPRLTAAIDADIAGKHSHARALDADTKKGPLQDIHRRVATAILFESSGGQADKAAHLPELRFALGGPDLDTTSIDNAAHALETKGFFIRKVGSDGFRFGANPTLRKVVNDRRASLDEGEVVQATLAVIKEEFERGKRLPLVSFPEDALAVADSPKLTLAVLHPSQEWSESGTLAQQLAEWTAQRGKSPRLYPGAIVWCVKKPGRDLRDKVEAHLAWKRVQREEAEGLLGKELEASDRQEIRTRVKTADDDAHEEVWGAYRYAIISDNREKSGLRAIDLGAGHSSQSESLSDRVIGALKSEGYLSESVGAGYFDRNWPLALKEAGEWPLSSLRQAFVNGTLIRLIDPDETLRTRIAEAVAKSEFGLASGRKPDGTFERVWFGETDTRDEVRFESDVYLLRKKRAEALRTPPSAPPVSGEEAKREPPPGGVTPPPTPPTGVAPTTGRTGSVAIHVTGTFPPELWNRVGRGLLTKMRPGQGLIVHLDLRAPFPADQAEHVRQELRQVLHELGIAERVRVDVAGEG